jgi:hypothetical protein
VASNFECGGTVSQALESRFQGDRGLHDPAYGPMFRPFRVKVPRSVPPQYEYLSETTVRLHI